MRAALDDVVGGRSPKSVRWASLAIPYDDPSAGHSSPGSTRKGNRGNKKTSSAISRSQRFASVDSEALQELSELVSLDVSGHALTDLEGFRTASPCLQELVISHNRLRRLEGVGRLIQLRVLNVSDNALERLPAQVGLLINLRFFDLRKNRLTNLSDLSHLEGCKQLFRLSLAGNPLSSVANLTAVVLRHCKALVQLDEAEVGSLSRNRRSVASPGEAQASPNSSVAERQTKEELIEERAARAAAAEEADELRKQLEEVSQLLARKTSEWAVAEEQASALKQQLAFIQIDMQGSENGLRKAVPSSKNEADSWRGETPIPLEEHHAADGSEESKDDSLAVSTSLSKNEAFRSLEREITDNAARTLRRLKLLTDDQREAATRLDELQSQHEHAVAAFDRIKQQLNATEERARSSADKCAQNHPEPVRAVSELLTAKERERGELIALVGKLRQARAALKRKMELAQDLMVMRTETLVNAEDDAEQDGSKSSLCMGNQAKAERLQSEHQRACIDAVSILSDVSGCASSSSRVRELFPSLTLLLSALDEGDDDPDGVLSLGTGLGAPSQSSLVWDASISHLSTQVMATKEQDLAAKDCLDGCLSRIAQVERAAALLKEDVVAQDDAAKARASANEQASAKSLHELRAGAAEESEAVARLEAQVRAGRVRLRELAVSILKIKSDAWRAEAGLRAKQSALLARTLRAREAALHACSRTIERRMELPLSEDDHKEYIRDQQRLSDVRSQEVTFRGDGVPVSGGGRTDNDSATSSATTPAQERADPSLVLADLSEQKARTSRRQVFEQLVDSEASYVASLTSLVNGLLQPMRRRCLLPPRDLQVICGHFSELLHLHQGILSSFQQQQQQHQGSLQAPPDGTRIVAFLHKRLEKIRTAYSMYSRDAPDSVALLEVRRRQHQPFDALLRAGSETYGRDACEFMLQPATRLQQYSNCVARLLQLQTTPPNSAGSAVGPSSSSSVAHKLRELGCALTELLFLGDRAKLVARARALGNLRAVLPGHSRHMSGKNAAWLQDRLVAQELDFMGKATCGETLLLRPGSKAITLTRAECIVFGAFVVIAAYPLRFRAAFEGHKPKLKAATVLRADRALDTSAPFAGVDSAYGLRLFTSRGEEVVMRFERREDVDKIHQLVKTIVRERLSAAANDGHSGTDNRAQEYGCDSPSSPAAIAYDKDGQECDSASIGGSSRKSARSATRADDQLSYAPKYPGTDMAKRRELAQKIKTARGAWQPPELENVEAELARERIKNRDGLALRDIYTHHPGASDGIGLRKAIGSPGKRDESKGMSPKGNKAQQRHLMITPIKLQGGASTFSSAKRPLKGPLGFGSTSTTDRSNVPTSPKPHRRPSNAAANAANKYKARVKALASQDPNTDEEYESTKFDPSSVHYMSNQGVPASPKANFSIFKAPRSKGPETQIAFQANRFIGLNTGKSEKIKEANRQELRYYQRLEEQLDQN